MLLLWHRLTIFLGAKRCAVATRIVCSLGITTKKKKQRKNILFFLCCCRCLLLLLLLFSVTPFQSENFIIYKSESVAHVDVFLLNISSSPRNTKSVCIFHSIHTIILCCCCDCFRLHLFGCFRWWIFFGRVVVFRSLLILSTLCSACMPFSVFIWVPLSLFAVLTRNFASSRRSFWRLLFSYFLIFSLACVCVRELCVLSCVRDADFFSSISFTLLFRYYVRERAPYRLLYPYVYIVSSGSWSTCVYVYRLVWVVVSNFMVVHFVMCVNFTIRVQSNNNKEKKIFIKFLRCTRFSSRRWTRIRIDVWKVNKHSLFESSEWKAFIRQKKIENNEKRNIIKSIQSIHLLQLSNRIKECA